MEEREIDLLDMIADILSHWKGLLVALIIGAVLMGGFSYVKSYQNVQSTVEEETELNAMAVEEQLAHIAKFSQLGNIAYRTGKKLSWDGKSFHDTEADKLLCKEYRAPWELPKI